MKKSTKKLIAIGAISTILVATTGTTIGIVSNNYNKNVEAINNELIQESRTSFENKTKTALEQAQKLLPQSERQTIINEKTLSEDLLLSHKDIFKNNANFIQTSSYVDYINYNNLKENKSISVFLDRSLSEQERNAAIEGVEYLNKVVSTIDPSLSIKITKTLTNSPTCIHIKNGYIDGHTLGLTGIYNKTSPKANDAILITIANFLIKDLTANDTNYIAKYKTVLIHEIMHACGLDHNFRSEFQQSQYKIPNLMQTTVTSNSLDCFSPQEIAGLFYYFLSNTFKNNSSDEFFIDCLNKYLALVDYSLEQSRYYNNRSSITNTLSEGQIFQISFKDKRHNPETNSQEACDVQITFNYPYKNICTQNITFENGNTKTIVSPFFASADEKEATLFSVMSEDWNSIDYLRIAETNNMSEEIIKNEVKYYSLEEEVKKLDHRFHYKIEKDKTTVYVEIVAQRPNFWGKMTKKEVNYTLNMLEDNYKIIREQKKWNVDNIDAKETTEEIEKLSENENE